MAAPRRPNDRLVPAPGDELCIAFADTRSWRGSEPATETLNGLGDVLAWCAQAKAIDGHTRTTLEAWANRHGTEAAQLFAEAIAARELIYGLFSATAAGRAVAQRDVDALSRLLAAAPARMEVAVGTGGARDGAMWRLPPAVPTAASLLAPVLWSAGDLLVGEHLDRVRRCANDKCLWLFVDDSKSGTRRWCAMRACGNRAKAHRHYLRKVNPPAEASG
jgi:predicted RNA-binding Zn ribbon-like protein